MKEKPMKYLAAAFAATAMAFAAPVSAADAAFEADSAKLAAMLAEPQKGDKNANAVLLDKISFEPGCVDATLPSVHAGIR